MDRARAQSNVTLRRSMAELRRLQTERFLRAQLPAADGLVSQKEAAALNCPHTAAPGFIASQPCSTGPTNRSRRCLTPKIQIKANRPGPMFRHHP